MKLLELIVKLQDTKSIFRNLLHFSELTTKYQKEKLRKQSIYNYMTKNNIPRNKFNQGGKRPVLYKLQDTDERN